MKTYKIQMTFTIEYEKETPERALLQRKAIKAEILGYIRKLFPKIKIEEKL